jgi:tetratricopeptide (TPR) repeat protein
MQQQDWPFAIDIYEGLRQRIGNNDATILNNLAWAYSESGDVDRAVPLARRAWSLDRDNPATADTWAGCCSRAGGGPRAWSCSSRPRAARPAIPRFRRRLAEARAS